MCHEQEPLVHGNNEGGTNTVNLEVNTQWEGIHTLGGEELKLWTRDTIANTRPYLYWTQAT